MITIKVGASVFQTGHSVEDFLAEMFPKGTGDQPVLFKGNEGDFEVYEPVIETTTEPVIETTTEPVIETTTEPVIEATTEPVIETTTEPVVETTTEPVVETTTEPVIEATIETSDAVEDPQAA